MRMLTVLGATGAYSEPGQACSGFLIDWDGIRLALDLGYATLPRLLAHVPDADLDAVVITHEHPDHCIDLHGLFRIRHYGGQAAHRMPLFCPAGVLAHLEGLEPDVELHDAFAVHDLPGSFQLGPFALSCAELPHFVPGVGIRLDGQSAAIAYTGDTGPHPGLAELGLGVDLFIVDSTDRPWGIGAARSQSAHREGSRTMGRTRGGRASLAHAFLARKRATRCGKRGSEGLRRPCHCC